MKKLDQLRQQFTSHLRPIGELWRRVAQESLLAHGISVPCGSALLAIARLGEGVSQSALAEELGIEAASLVRSVDQLAQAGLVRREKGLQDQRVKTLWFTDTGRALASGVEHELITLRARMLADVPREDLEAALRVFRIIEGFAQASTTVGAAAKS
ncbi:MarR family transcriptional regulator, transcriptional regulator for hemolysin [Pseudomonas citronellolis]|uniref:MarR family transcriptional regulator, transcriptional regulator for hemolysin n=1 Tax=Pseudomonas citronellolis TaxID=53408 RepID=A0AAQ1KNQ4_9PSED|nr:MULTISPECIES: MarR family transcriptional regulator [Pseudomonas]MCL6692471.1 MarR family transcriptional regulator [Pseudomonas sp. R3.Fl]TGC25785.1 MarR family transcriptional regulator [Pseudomonas citronellolis]UUC52400.1 MarR family transcriptional regulator [Pseudomonas citronellolis]SFD93938.1 MarR family transcriptional regulator, transcriptional regulator for hemolysin [Pseudomonas citronellolis]